MGDREYVDGWIRLWDQKADGTVCRRMSKIKESDPVFVRYDGGCDNIAFLFYIT